MANFRCERLYIMLDEPVPGLDHMGAVDVVAFAGLGSGDDAAYLDVTPLESFCFAPFEKPRWQPVAKGLATVRVLIEFYEKWMACGQKDPGRFTAEVLAEKLAVLRQVEAVLDAADGRDRRFYLRMRDLA